MIKYSSLFLLLKKTLKNLRSEQRMKKIMLVFGTRPEAIKMAPLVLALQKSQTMTPIVVTTGQHKEMLQQVMAIFNITADYELNIMAPGQTLTEITTKVLAGLKEIIHETCPDMLLVHGDTTTSISAALAAFYQQVPIGHVEAGLRTLDKYSPYPEEMNRQLTGRLANLHFAPTEQAKANLIQEGITDGVYVTGNTSIDAVHYTTHLPFEHELITAIQQKKRRLVLMTIHRRENLEENMANIFTAIKAVVDQREDIEVVFPVHLNPFIQTTAQTLLGDHPRIHLFAPLDVVSFHHFIKNATFVISDSGGVQEEAPSLGIPVLVARDTTERPEGVAAGNLKLVGVAPQSIIDESLALLDDVTLYTQMSQATNPYGSGNTAVQIVLLLEDYFARK